MTLKKWMRENGITQVALVEMLADVGVSITQPAISQLINEVHLPTLTVAVAIERVTKNDVPCSAWVDL